MIYLDNASTTQISDVVFEAMEPYLKNNFGNPGSVHSLGRASQDAVHHARQQVADLIGAEIDNIIFTSGGSEANNLCIKGYANKYSNASFAVSNIEHESLLRACDDVKSRGSFVYLIKPNGYGYIDSKSVLNAIEIFNVNMVSVMMINNETGKYNDFDGIGLVCKAHNVLFHTDAVQALGTSQIDVNSIGCDFLSMSSHKIHGPKGIGALYVRDKSKIAPLIRGGDYQEFGYRGGTENVAGIVGFGQACEETRKLIRTKDRYRCEPLSKLFMDTLRNELSLIGLENKLHYNSYDVLPSNIINARIDGIDAETLVLACSTKGLFISAGSACNSLNSEPSHVLKAIGLTDDEARNSFRVSFSRLNTDDDAVDGARIIAECAKILINQF